MLIKKIALLVALIASTFILSSFASEHDLDMASFTFNLEEENSNLKVGIDKEKFDTAIYKGNFNTSENNQLPQLALRYFKENLNLAINNQSIEFSEIVVIKKLDHYNFTLIVNSCAFPIETIEIKNTCLTEEIEGQNNIVTIKYNEGRRDFRMDKKRSVINLEY